MAVDWRSVPTEPAAEQVSAIVGEHGGAVVVAPVGAGKTTVARAVAERLDGPSAWVTGTVSDRVIPFAALRHLVEVPEEGKTTAVLRAARESVPYRRSEYGGGEFPAGGGRRGR